MMNLDKLRYFVTTARTQHIGKAAKALNISPSAISHAVRDLEEEIGHPLFMKMGKNIRLTEIGVRFSSRAKELLTQVEKVRSEFRSTVLPLEGTIKLGVTHGLSNLFVAPILGGLIAKHPKLLFHVYSLRSAQVVEMAVAGEIDFGICFSPNAHPSVRVHHKITNLLKIAVKPGHFLLKAKQRNLPDLLSDLPSSGPISFPGIEVCDDHPALKKAGIRSTTTIMSDSYEVGAEYIKKSQGWCLMPEILIEPLGLKALEFSALQAEVNISFISPKSRTIPKILEDTLLHGFPSL